MLTNLYSRLLTEKSKRILQVAYVVVFFCLVLLILLARVAAAPLSHDEYQFVAGGQWFARQLLLPYVDYSFLHMPYQLAVNGLAAAISDYDFLSMRIFTGLFNLASSLLLFWFVSRLLKDSSVFFQSFMGSLSIAIFLFNPSLITTDGRALNHALPVALSLLSVVFYLRAATRPDQGRWLFLAGIMCGLATGVRLSYAVVVVPFVTVLALEWICDAHFAPLKKILIYLSGLIIALLPVGGLFLAAPMPFYFGNYVYIRLNTLYRQEVGFESSMNLISKLRYFIGTVLSHPVSLLLYLILFAVSLYALIRFIRHKEPIALQALLVSLLAWALIAAGFAPTPLWIQYFLAPVPFLILSAIYAIRFLPRRNMKMFLGLSIAVIFLTGFSLKNLSTSLAVLRQPERWVPIQVHQFAMEMKRLVPDGNVLSLASIYGLEAGLGSYPQLTVGPFVWRTAPLLSAEGRDKFQLVSFHELEGLLENAPPAVILTGVETDYGFDKFDPYGLDKPLIDFALQHGFEPRYQFNPPFWVSTITLWVKP